MSSEVIDLTTNLGPVLMNSYLLWNLGTIIYFVPSLMSISGMVDGSSSVSDIVYGLISS